MTAVSLVGHGASHG